MQHFIKLLLSLHLWRKYRASIQSLLLGGLLMLVIWIAHSEYIAYTVAVNNTQGVGWSYVIKWGLLVFVAAITLLNINKTAVRSDALEANRTPAKTDEPQHPLRYQNKLKSKGDIILERYKKDH